MPCRRDACREYVVARLPVIAAAPLIARAPSLHPCVACVRSENAPNRCARRSSLLLICAAHCRDDRARPRQSDARRRGRHDDRAPACRASRIRDRRAIGAFRSASMNSHPDDQVRDGRANRGQCGIAPHRCCRAACIAVRDSSAMDARCFAKPVAASSRRGIRACPPAWRFIAGEGSSDPRRRRAARRPCRRSSRAGARTRSSARPRRRTARRR
ncbi:hypothetical protein BTM_5078 [Burkholderia thailandensis 34]|nr:hypothetical protein BTM_5078 [Burkholderia thailandensis 34]